MFSKFDGTTREGSNFVESTVCGNCGKHVAIEMFMVIKSKTYNNNQGHPRTDPLYFIGQCPLCGCPTIFNYEKKIWLPAPLPFTKIKNVPQEIEPLYTEIRQDYAVGCYSSAILAARKLIMFVAVSNGAETNKKFEYYVDYLDSNGCLPKNSKAWIDKIRIAGNEQTHEIVMASKEDAERTIKLVVALLTIMYELPQTL